MGIVDKIYNIAQHLMDCSTQLSVDVLEMMNMFKKLEKKIDLIDIKPRHVEIEKEIADIKERMKLVDTIATSTAIGTDLHPKRIEKIESVLQEHDTRLIGHYQMLQAIRRKLEEEFDDWKLGKGG